MKTEIVPSNTLINLQISDYFLQRLQEMAVWIVTERESGQIQAVHNKIQNGLPLEDWEYHYFTLIALIHEAETAARSQNKTAVVVLSHQEDSP